MKTHIMSTVLALSIWSTGLFANEGEREVLFYRNPMNPAITSPMPAKDHMGMDYIPVYADEAQSEATVSIDPAIVQNLGVRTEPATRGKLWRRIDTLGTVAYDETQLLHIHVRAEGWIEQLGAHFVGQRVKAGELLFEIYSPQLANAQAELLQAHKTGQRDLIEASRQRLELLGVDREQIRALERSGKATTRIQVRAPQDGVVTDLNARHGMYVQPDMQVLTLADLSSVWIVAEVYERQAAWVAPGQPVEVRLKALPGEVIEGEVDYVYPSLDAQTRTLRARLRVANPQERLKPDMLADVRIFAGPKDGVLSVPRLALIRGGDSDRVIVAEGDGKFRAVEVVTGIESGDWVEVVGGIEAGDQIVVSGQFLIDSEASIKASAVRMLGAEAGSSTTSSPVPIEVSGTITQIKAEQRLLTIDHPAVPELDWPAMTMDFDLAADVSIDALQPQDKVRFTLVQGADGGYVIDSIRVQSE